MLKDDPVIIFCLGFLLAFAVILVQEVLYEIFWWAVGKIGWIIAKIRGRKD